MKTLENGQDKIQKICNELRTNTLEPAKKEAEEIISEAQGKAKDLIKEAEEKCEQLINDARRSIEQERNVFHSSLSQAVKQSLESLKQDIDHKLFNDQLNELIKNKTSDPQIIAKIIDCLVKAVEIEGLSADLSAYIPKHVSESEINLLLAEGILRKLKNNSVSIGSFSGGATVKLEDKGLTS